MLVGFHYQDRQFAKGIMPKIFVELNLERKYLNPHLDLNT
jgi:hypothetical protein